ncbi:hypothetical protein KY289_035330 [Solanum tuberosum]|nr:hypothetical protein KY289_035330 [Solanum tuberosum]
MILREWKIQWEILDIVEEARQIVEQNSFKVQHAYREGNQLVDVIANSAYSKSEVHKYKQFEQLLANCKRILNMDKAQIASLRIKKER